MKTFVQILREKKFTIEVDVRDAKKALAALKDDPNMKFKTDGSNFYIFKSQDDFFAAEDILKRAKIKPAELQETRMKAIDFIADQMSNDEGSTDAEMVLHLAKETHIPVGKMSKLVKSLRPEFLRTGGMHIQVARDKIKKFV